MGKDRVVRQLRQDKGAQQLCPLRDESHDAPVVSPEERPQHEKGEELRLPVVGTVRDFVWGGA
jgi:hypothetical protein